MAIAHRTRDLRRQSRFLLTLVLALLQTPAVCAVVPQMVTFASADDNTELVGYLYAPSGSGPYPAIVLLHGRGGLYSSLRRGTYTAETLTMRHRMWGEFWASRGYVALLVDSLARAGTRKDFPKALITSARPR